VIDPKLIEYARTDRQREILTLLAELGSKRKVAAQLGIPPITVRRALYAVERYAAEKGYSPKHGIEHPLPEHLMLSGTSTLTDMVTGEQRLQWLKSSMDRHQLKANMIAAANALTAGLPKEKPVPPPEYVLDDMLSTYVITDMHFGMLAWHEEGGDNWNLNIAENALYDWASKATSMVPKSKRAILAQLGDHLHHDSLDSVTPTNRHSLDADGRYPKIVEATVRGLRRMIQMLLSHHQEVVVLMVEGNHDPIGSVWLREMFSALYEDEPRVTVDKSPLPYYCVEHGNTSVLFSHGHLKKPKEIAEVFAAQFRNIIGRTKYSYAHMGHMHHSLVHETPLMVIEQHQTLAAKDAYAARGGWHSQRGAQVITYSAEHGEIGRVRIPFSMIRREEEE
jgi:hypothetical protein